MVLPFIDIMGDPRSSCTGTVVLLILLALHGTDSSPPTTLPAGASRVGQCGGCFFIVDADGVLRKDEDFGVADSGVLSCFPATCRGTLDLSGKYIKSLSDGVFDSLDSLEVLNLSRNLLTMIPFGAFSHLSGLKVLKISRNSLSVDQGGLPTSLLSGSTALEDLDLSFNRLVSLPADMFAYTSSIRRVILNDNLLESVSDALFSACALIEEIRLDNNAISSIGSGAFSANTALQTLRLSHNKLSSAPDVSSNTLLEYLSLHGNLIPSIPAGTFENNPLLLDDLYVEETSRVSPEACSAGLKQPVGVTA